MIFDTFGTDFSTEPWYGAPLEAHMRKLFALTIYLSSALLLFGASQRIIDLDSPVYRNLSHLYLLQNKALPSTAWPYNDDEALRLLSALDRKALSSAAERALYRAVEEELESARTQRGNLGYRISASLTLEGYLHTNVDDFNAEHDWTLGYGKRRPLGVLTFETWPLSSFYSYFALPVMNNFGVVSPNSTTPNQLPNTLYGKHAFTTNVIMLGPNKIENIDLNFPYRAFVSLGGDHWNIQVGRERISWGAGKSGNFMVSDNLPYQQMGRFTTYFDTFKYTLLASFFAHPQINDYPLPNLGANQQDLLGDGMKLFLAHRVEVRLLEQRLALAISESMMYQSATGSIDLRFINPVGFYHNQYIRGNSNSMLSFEADYTVARGINAYVQVGVDEITFGEEKAPEANAKPDAFAYMAGVQAVIPLGGGILTLALEGAYTDPFLYLRERYEPTSQQFGVGYDVIIRVLSRSMENLRYWQGYPYGGDAITAYLTAGWELAHKLSIKGDLLFLAHGVLGYDSLWRLYSGSEALVTTPTTQNPFDPTEQGEVSYTLLPTASVHWQITAPLSAMVHIALPMVWNKGNVPRPMARDLQASFGLRYTF